MPNPFENDDGPAAGLSLRELFRETKTPGQWFEFLTLAPVLTGARAGVRLAFQLERWNLHRLAQAVLLTSFLAFALWIFIFKGWPT